MTYDDESYCCWSETSEEYKLRQKKAAEDLKKLDKNYEKISVPVKEYTDKNGRVRKSAYVELYGSGSSGTRVRNAVTGATYNIIVGSRNEEIFFKVIDSTGRNRRREPLMLYYDSPEQYENHQFTTVNPDIKQKWHRRSFEAQKRLEKD